MRALTPKLITEFAGTLVFFTVIGLSANAAVFAPIAIGAALMAVVYMGGHVSGAHYNPAVSAALYLRRVIPARVMLAYWATQVVAGIAAFALARAVSGRPNGVHASGDWPAALACEVVFTAALALVVLNVAATRATEGNSFYGLAIGMTVAAGAFVAGPVSGGVFNPAVGLSATLTDAVAGGGSWSSLWLYLVGPFAGAAAAALIHGLQNPPPERTVAPERSERTTP